MSATANGDMAAATVARPAAGHGRLDAIDGLRGWSALCVVLYHVFWETFGALIPAFRNPVTGFLLDGRLAVCVFFVLSGEALSSAFFAGKGDAATIRLAIKRYPRLTIPILAACLLIFALDRSGLVYNADAAQIVRRPEWMGAWLRNPLSLAETLRYALFDVFASADFRRGINPMLWTMRIELIGSFVVFALLFAWRRVPAPRAFALVLFLSTAAAPYALANYLSCFFAGVIFADWRALGVFAPTGRRFAWGPAITICIVGAADGLLHCAGDERGKAVFGVVLTLALYASPPLVGFFSGSLSRALGRISFPLYLVQFPVLVSLTSALIVRIGADQPLSILAVWGIAFASVAICLLAAIAFEPVETLARRTGDALVAVVARTTRRLRGADSATEREARQTAEIAAE